MSTWDRTQRVELDLAIARGRIYQLEDALIAMAADLGKVTEERDSARRIAVRLEQENAALADVRDVRLVPYWGTAT